MPLRLRLRDYIISYNHCNAAVSSSIMVWQTYQADFTAKALAARRPIAETEMLLAYAKNIYDKGMPIIYDIGHLSLLVGYKVDFLVAASTYPRAYYRNFRIKKKSGASRVISEPLPSLKAIQTWILENILEKFEVSLYAKAYVKGRSIKENARFHRNQNNVLTIDIKNFFGSVTKVRIISFFSSLGYSRQVALLLARLCCKNSRLPQGAPTSPTLSNIVLIAFDEKLFKICSLNKVRFTRYADDITFSYEDKNLTGPLIEYARELLKGEGLVLNRDKTRLMERHQRQEVTGVIVNKKLQVPIEIRKDLRQIFYYINKFGLDSHIERIQEKRSRYLYHVLGLCNFVLFINPNDKEIKGYLITAREYLTSEK